MEKGFTLIEVIVVIFIIAILSVIGSANVIRFQKDAILDSAANEFASVLQSAREKSQDGEAVEGQDISYYEPDYLPSWNVLVANNSYSLNRNYRKSGDSSDTTDLIENHNLTAGWTFSPTGSVSFRRITGDVSGLTAVIMTDARGIKRLITIDARGNIVIKEI